MERGQTVLGRLLEQPLLSGSGLRNAYARLPIIGPDKQWHMIWMWRDTPHCETCHDLSYARSPDMINWFTYRATVPAADNPRTRRHC
ncbi:hypothetical protein CWS02_23110 [Enterobacter sp. EA-1]|nr:hypothetical protein CWS02_23110 [Enterobacter sp. EA-1]